MLGGAYQAKHGLLRGNKTFQEITESLPEPKLICEPYQDAESVRYYESEIFVQIS